MKNKYNAKKTTIDDRTFDSKAEANYYLVLKEQREKGEIKAFSCQKEYVLIPAFTKHGKRFRKMSYIADFYIEPLQGEPYLVDVKGVLTDTFKLKYKLFCSMYDIELKCIFFDRKKGFIEKKI